MRLAHKLTRGIALIALLALPLMASAQLAPPDVNLVTEGQFIGLLLRLLGLVRTIFWILAVAFILFAAFLYLTAGGSEDKVKRANKMLLYAVIAIVVALVATSLPFLVRSFLTT